MYQRYISLLIAAIISLINTSNAQTPTPDNIFISSFDNGLFEIPAGPSQAIFHTNFPTGINQDVCYDQFSDTFLVSSDVSSGPLYRVELSTNPPTVTLVGNLGASNEIACDTTQQTVPGFSDIIVTRLSDIVRYDGNGDQIGEPLMTSDQLVEGTPVGTIEAAGMDVNGTTTCGEGTIFVGTSSGVIALVPPLFSPVRLTSPSGAQFELAVDSSGNSPFDLASASFSSTIQGYIISSCDAAGASNTLVPISPQFTTGDDFCFDSVGNIILPNVAGGTVDQIGTGVPNPLGSRLILAPASSIPSPSGCTFLLGIEKTLAEKAADLAKSVEGGPYLGDGLTWGGKGWEWVEKRYVDSNEIRDGYRFWNNSIGMQDFGAGLDCSGLILWSYNKASRATNYLEGNSIRYPNANGQFLHNTEQINDDELQPGHLLFYDRNQDGYKDHVAMYIGEDQIIEAFGVQTGIQIDQLSNRTKPGTGFIGHFRKVIENPLIGIQVKVSSPVDLIVTDPDGFTITSKTFIQTDLEYAREIPGILYYSEGVSGIDGHPDDVVFAPISKKGDYIIQVVPEPDASPTDTYSLEIEADGTTIILAQDVLIRDIPTQGYGIEVAEGEVIQFIPVLIDIKPGSDPNSINPKSEGVIPVAILSTTVFDASSVIMIDKNLLTFGHVGDEKSLALRGNGVPNCSGEDINNDGLLDLVCHFSTQETEFKNGDTEGMLTGRTVDDKLIKGTDSVRIVP